MPRSNWQLVFTILLAGLSAYAAVILYPYWEWLLGATLAAVAVTGILLRVGWYFPCTVAGAYLGLLAIGMNPHIRHRTTEFQVVETVAWISIGAAAGCFSGLAVDVFKKRRALNRSTTTSQLSKKPRGLQPHVASDAFSLLRDR